MRRVSLLILMFCLGCAHHAPKINIAINLTDSNKSLKISGFDEAVVTDIAQNDNDNVWQALLRVYKMPADTDMKDFQRPQPGNYHLSGSAVIFTPDTPFINGQTYFLRCYQFGKGKSTWDMIKGKQKLGSQAYTDLTFKK